MRSCVLGAATALIAWGGFVFATAAPADRWIPIRWPGGPLDVAWRAAQRKAPVEPAAAATLRNWLDAASLDLLRDTPINCLVVAWSGGGADPAAEREQQRQVTEYARKAHSQQVAVVGMVFPGADSDRAVATARAANLDGLVFEGESAKFVEAQRREAPAARPLALIPIAAGVAPGIRVLSDSGAATATPTSEPWIDSNTWLVRSLRVQTRGPVWLAFALEAASPDDYLRAIADTSAAGGRWVVQIDDALLAGLARRRPEALAAWSHLAGALRFFASNEKWRGFAPAGPLGIVHDPAGPHADLSAENLNLIARRRIPYRIILRSALGPAAVADLTAVLATGLSEPAENESRLLRAFAERGGLVVTGPGWGRGEPVRGEGRIVVCPDDPPDPESLSKEVLDLIGKANLGVRLFNAPSVLPYVSANDGGQLLVQMVNYASEPAETLTVRVAGDYRTARLYVPGRDPVTVPFRKSAQGSEARIAQFPVYAALLLEK